MTQIQKCKPFLKKQEALTSLFSSLPSNEARYQKIMSLGKELPPFDPSWKTEENLVEGCQSIMHLHAKLQEGKLYFFAASDALISSGLAFLLITLYSGEAPETVLTSPPTFLKECGIMEGLSLSRANGLLSLYLKMKQTAVTFLASNPS